MGEDSIGKAVRAYQEAMAELKRHPRRYELTPKFMTDHLLRTVGGMEKLKALAGAPTRTAAEEEKLVKQFHAICSRKEQIQGFFRHTLDLEDLFKRAGNPPSLKLIAQPDTHVKFMHRPAMNALLRFGRWHAPHVWLILGDFADCEGVAHWEPNSREPRRIVPEMKIARDLLAEINAATPTVSTRIFLEGNHENWIEQALNRMPELFEGLDDLDLGINVKKLLALEKFGYNFFPLNHLVQIGKAHFTHGSFTQQHHAKKHLDTYKGNIYYGHLHDIQSHNQTSLEGHMEGASLGCLCRLDAHFLKGKPNNWVHAFGIFEFFPDGTYTFVRPTIFDGKFSFAGVVFDGNLK